MGDNCLRKWSVCEDLNLRNPAPKAGGMGRTNRHTVKTQDSFW